MIDFNHKPSWADTCRPEEVDEVRADHNKRIKADLENIGSNKFSLGAHLLDLYSSNAYANNIQRKREWRFVKEKSCYDWVELDDFWGNVRPVHFFEYCEEMFGLDKTQVSRCMNVVDEFGDQAFGFKKEWQDYSYSQLVELLPLTPEQRKEVKPDWSVKRIREYKKSLVATSQQADDDKKALQAYSKFSSVPVTIPLSGGRFNYKKYDRFRGYTLEDILDRLICVESELEEKTKQLSEKTDAAALPVSEELNILSEEVLV